MSASTTPDQQADLQVSQKAKLIFPNITNQRINHYYF